MSDLYYQLLDATIEHVKQLQQQGVKLARVAPETLAALSQPARPRAPAADRVRVSASPPARSSSPATQAIPVAAKSASDGAMGALEAKSGLASSEQEGPQIKETHAAVMVLDPEELSRRMGALRERAFACQKCPHLVAGRKNVVFGVGDLHATLMFVGEAPGADEDEQGEPFVGKAGQLLTKIIQATGLSRQTVYIANILKCRPDTPGQTAGNRKPTLDEMQTCKPYLVEQIELIKPKVIVALGATAVQGLLGLTTGITRLRGNFQAFRGIPVMPTYHPAYLLRNQSLSVKRQVWEDMLQVMTKLGLPITDKQRQYFLPKVE